MRNLYYRSFLFVCVLILLFTCGCKSDENKYETRYSPDGKDSVVYVHYRDNNGQYQDFFLNYLMFRTLFGNGGYSACHNYYNSNPAPRINNYHTYVVNENRPSSYNSYPRSSAHTSNATTSSKSSWGSGSNNTSSSSSSSSSRKSYSSPSRSSGYSSGRSSYSSPSRSSNSSRSYSSPSRH